MCRLNYLQYKYFYQKYSFEVSTKHTKNKSQKDFWKNILTFFHGKINKCNLLLKTLSLTLNMKRVSILTARPSQHLTAQS